MAIARQLKNLYSSSKHDRPHTKRIIHKAKTNNLHARNFYDKYESMRGLPSLLVFQNKKVSRYVQCQVKNNKYNRMSIEPKEEHNKPRVQSAAASLPTIQLHTSVQCILPSRNKSQFSVANTAQEPTVSNLKCKIKTPTNFCKCLSCTTRILGLFKRFQTLASTDC
jgi:hypothetical protein